MEKGQKEKRKKENTKKKYLCTYLPIGWLCNYLPVYLHRTDFQPLGPEPTGEVRNLVQLDVWELGPVTEEARKLVWLEVCECSRSGSLQGSKTGFAGGLEEQVRILVRLETWFGKRPGSDAGEVRNLVQ